MKIKKDSPRLDWTRSALQSAGEQLDAETNGGWVVGALTDAIIGFPDDAVVALDSVRTHNQIEALRAEFRDKIRHVHLKALALSEKGATISVEKLLSKKHRSNKLHNIKLRWLSLNWRHLPTS